MNRSLRSCGYAMCAWGCISLYPKRTDWLYVNGDDICCAYGFQLVCSAGRECMAWRFKAIMSGGECQVWRFALRRLLLMF